MDFAPGSTVGSFVLDQPIGSGSFGAVWRGHDQRSGRPVAIKLLTGALASAESAAMRADVEVLAATAAARSQHVVGVLGGGADPVPYIVMEFIEGTDLQQKLNAQGRLSVRETIDVALAIADAIRALYDAGIIHRDIKPANVLIDTDGVIKLADFGIAKIVGYMTLTMTGQTAMTMAYAAPELWDTHGELGGPSNKSDLYAMGVLLYQCLAGSLPFSGNYGALYRAHAEQTPDLGKLPPETPPSLRSLIRRCLNKAPADRPADAAECLGMLERAQVEVSYADGQPIPEPARFGPWLRETLHPTEPWTWRCRHETSGDTASVEVHFANTLDRANTLRRAVDASVKLAPLGAEKLLGTNRLLLHPEERWLAAPDGRFQFWVAREDAAGPAANLVTAPLLRMAIRQLAALLDAASAEGISLLSPASDLTVGPDGGIYLFRPGLGDPGADAGETALSLLRRLPVDNTARQMLVGTPDFETLVASVGPPSVPPAGETVLATREASPPTVLAAGQEPPGQPTQIGAPPPRQPDLDHTPPTQIGGPPPLPPDADATRIGPPLQVAGPARPAGPSSKAGSRVAVSLLAAAAAIAAIAAAAYLAIGGGNDGDATGAANTPAPTAPAVVSPTAAPGVLALLPGAAASRDALLFVSDRDGDEEIYIMNPDGTNQTRLTNTTGQNRLPDGSSDGLKIAFVSERAGGSELYIMNGDGSDQRLITTAEGIKLEPSFSPDGKKLVFEVKRGDNFDIYVVNIDGTGLTNITPNTPNSAEIDPAWSPDGTRIVFCSDRDGNMDLYVMNADGTNLRKVAANAGFEAEPEWSPDSKRIVFQSNRSGNFDLYIINDDGTGLVRLTNDPRDEFDPVWSPDGSRIAYTLVTPTNMEVYVVNADGTNPRAITNNPANDQKPSWTVVRRQ